MARLSADWDRVQTAKFLISKCDPAPLSGSKTYYTRLWSCKFVREWEVTSNDDAGTDEEVNDTLSEFMLRSERVPQRSERMVVSYVDDKTTISVLPPEPVAAGQTSLAGNLETSRIVWEGLDIHDPSALLRCIAAKGLHRPLDISTSGGALNLALMQKEMSKGYEDFFIGKLAGCCELIVKVSSEKKILEPDSKPCIPFDARTTLGLVTALNLPLRWLSTTGDDSGSFYSEVDRESGSTRYCFQSPFYKEGAWNLALCVRPPTFSLTEIIKGALKVDRNLSEGFKTVGVLEAGSSIDLATMFDEIHLSAPQSSHPLVLPLRLFEEHVKQTSKSFMRIAKKLADVEQAIDVSLNSDLSFQNPKTNDNTGLEGIIEQRPYGRWSKTVYECSTELHELERRRDFEWRFEKFLTDDGSTLKLPHSGLKEMMDWLAVIKASSSTRDFDIRSLPRRIEALTSLIRNLVDQQHSQANIQIARLSMQENFQMTALTKASIEIANQTKALGAATLKDSNSMKNLAVLATIFLPGTYIASLFSTSMFNFSDPTRLQVSNHLWLYWVITVPLTVMVFSVLQGIRYREREEKDKDDEECRGEKNQNSPKAKVASL